MNGNLLANSGRTPQSTKIELAIKNIQMELPDFLSDYYLFLRGAVSASTRYAYLVDIRSFFQYICHYIICLEFGKEHDLKIDHLIELQPRVINLYLDHCRCYSKSIDGKLNVIENNNRSLSRKKSSLSSLFRFLYRNGQLPNDITPGFNPIKLPKPHDTTIKRLHSDEVKELLEIVETGRGLSDTERVYWNKTKLRDRTILLLFLTYGLRLSELTELNIGSINFRRKNFTIYRKRNKESVMPLNRTIENALMDYINLERDNDSKSNALFLSLQKTRISNKSVRNLVKKYNSIVMKTTRNNGYSPHKLRATTATLLIERGVSIFDVQNYLDHENVTTTQLYAAHRNNVRVDIADNFELDQL